MQLQIEYNDYAEFQTIDSISIRRHSSVLKKKKGSNIVVQKIIPINLLNKEYVKLQIQLMADIDSDYVVKIKHYHLEEQQRTLKIYMPYYSNGDLQNYLLTHPNLTFQTKMTMFIDILSGLKQLHTRFIIHRDLKLMNIFVDQSGRCVVGDLGIASVTQGVMKTQIGTFGYQAPDVFSYQGEYDQKVDIWGLGIIAFQLFNPIKYGKLAYPFNDWEKYTNQMGGIDYEKYMCFTGNLLPFDSSISFKLSYLITKMLKNNPKQRIGWVQIYQSDILYELSRDKRLISMKADYKCAAETRQILRDYKKFIDEFMLNYNQKLKQLLIQKRMSDKQRDLIEKNCFDLFAFYYLSLKKIAQKYRYFQEKKIYRTIEQLKQKINTVQGIKADIQIQINIYLARQGEKQIAKNKKLLQQQYYVKLEEKIKSLLFQQQTR